MNCANARMDTRTAWCSEVGPLWSLDAPELHASVTSENQFHCTRLYTHTFTQAWMLSGHGKLWQRLVELFIAPLNWFRLWRNLGCWTIISGWNRALQHSANRVCCVAMKKRCHVGIKSMTGLLCLPQVSRKKLFTATIRTTSVWTLMSGGHGKKRTIYVGLSARQPASLPFQGTSMTTTAWKISETMKESGLERGFRRQTGLPPTTTETRGHRSRLLTPALMSHWTGLFMAWQMALPVHTLQRWIDTGLSGRVLEMYLFQWQFAKLTVSGVSELTKHVLYSPFLPVSFLEHVFVLFIYA